MGRLRTVLPWIGGIVALAILALAASAILPGAHSTRGAPSSSRAAVARAQSPANQLTVRETSVFGSGISAARYGTEIAQREAGVDARGQLSSDLDPVPARAFRGPIAAYRRYATRWAGRLAVDARALTTALRFGSRPAARRAWDAAFDDYLHLGASYGLLPRTLDDALAGMPASLGARRFSGLHRIEKGLWTNEPVRSLAGYGRALSAAVARARRALPRVAITPLDYATRAHEILEDAQRDLMSGTQVPWSGAGVLGTAAGVQVTHEVIDTLVPILQGRENTLVIAQNWLVRLQSSLNGVRRRDGTWPALDQLSRTQRERLDGTLAGTVGALSLVPATLETANVPEIPELVTHRTAGR